jgi:superfamily II DNA/RNA helicase
MQQLPQKTTEIVRIVPTKEQKEINDANVKIAAQIASKPYFTEMDLIRLQKALLLARMSADSTFLVDKCEPSYSSKLEYLAELLSRLLDEKGRKIILFSEWTTMLDCIEKILIPLNTDYVRLDGSVAQKKRQMLVNKFQNDDTCRLFITTNAGSTGLNLQSANTVINVDLPWNPAILDQRIARAHRMGQQKPVHVYLLVTDGTIEERMLATLSNKKDLALAALDVSSDVTAVEMSSSIDDLKKKLEQLLGAKPEAPVDNSMLETLTNENDNSAPVDLEKASEASGKLLSAVFSFIEHTLPPATTPPDNKGSPLALALQESFISISKPAADGKVKLELTFDSSDAINSLGTTIAMLLEATGIKFPAQE